VDAQGVITVPPIFDQGDIGRGLGSGRGHGSDDTTVLDHFPEDFSLNRFAFILGM